MTQRKNMKVRYDWRPRAIRLEPEADNNLSQLSRKAGVSMNTIVNAYAKKIDWITCKNILKELDII